MPNISPIHLVIVLIIALIVIGPGKLPEVGAALGKSIKEFRKAASDITETAHAEAAPITAATAAAVAPTPAAPAPVAPAPVTYAAAAPAYSAPEVIAAALPPIVATPAERPDVPGQAMVSEPPSPESAS
ncbi:MAG TPA: twin-arginine translocase TatA/TatE family subunit [Candidatus Limnocylindrales bacterium]|nr:twin-arginine translocase TatA/TatE family subunit [Candidatus Limnocylindrales bacterium]